MQKRYLPITAAVVILAVIALLGYMRPAEPEEMPRRILFDSTAGSVIFSHLEHDQSYGIDCATCHHESRDPGASPLECGVCHPQEFSAAYIEAHTGYFSDAQHCARCHHAEFTGMVYDHDLHAEMYTAGCTDCHHGEDIEPEPQNCGDCHMETGDETMPGLKDAAHERCSACHQPQFDTGLEDCSQCHRMLDSRQGDAVQTTEPCGTCHEQAVEQLVPTRMNAFHDSCMGCHEEFQAGPFGETECNQCHRPR
ncbi:MAG: cytochrome c3 family protein [Desulfovibrionales bacterium]